MYCPFELEVIPPNDSPTKENQIYDRYYMIGSSITVQHEGGMTDKWLNAGCQVDKSRTLQSIHYKAQNTEYATQFTDANNKTVPDKFKEQILNLVNDSLRVDALYLESVIVQLKSLVSMIKTELETSIDKQEILDICKFRYDVGTMTFPTHSTDSNNWNNASNGLFGDKTGKLNDLYDSSIRDLDEYIFGEFVFDQSGETPSFNPDTIYQTLMKSPYVNKK